MGVRTGHKADAQIAVTDNWALAAAPQQFIIITVARRHTVLGEVKEPEFVSLSSTLWQTPE